MNVEFVPLSQDDREQFILDNQKAFRYGALEEFWCRDEHFEEDGEIISCKTIVMSIDGGEAYCIMLDGRPVGGEVIRKKKEEIWIFSLFHRRNTAEVQVMLHGVQ